MKKNIGIWIDFKQAFIITLQNNDHFIENVQSGIEFRERIEGETKKYGRFGGQYITYEKNRENKKNQQTAEYLKILLTKLNDNLILDRRTIPDWATHSTR